MLIRITRPRSGEVDGFDLAVLAVGEAYDLPSALALYLVVTQSARIVLPGEQPDDQTHIRERRGVGGVWPGWDIAADRTRRKP